LAQRADYAERATDCLEQLVREGFGQLPDEFRPLPKCLETLGHDPQRQMMAVEIFTRFLFSALVDADRLDTERSDPASLNAVHDRRIWRTFDAVKLSEQVNEFITGKHRDPASLAGREQDVQRVRDEVADLCRAVANEPRGLFSLTVPTGGGKTLASMLFALNHAKAHAQEATGQNGIAWKPIRRVIVVIPYLSIIHQTAAVLKDVFKHTEESPVVLEHHSSATDPVLDEKKLAQGKASDYSRTRTLRQLAAENWDAPIIVTTSVQFFNSLFSRSPADARKLHNIAQSVIIFDEVQTLPPHLLQPILDVLGELTNRERPYGCSAVFCTATQPALGHDENEFPGGLKNIRPIVTPAIATKHFNSLKRVEYSGIEKDAASEPLTPEQVAKQATANEQKQCLVVVNTRKSARQVFAEVQARAKAMGTPDAAFHLSTWMIPAHRLEVLEAVRRRLKEKKQCFLVSTQCIEAGVDVDFPEVWRAYGPYDSIVQAAGRCNREGKLDGLGNVHVFRLEGDDPEGRAGIYGTATTQTTLLRRMGRALPEDPTSFIDYFRLLYQISVPDECLIQQHRSELRFEEVSKLFQFIEDKTFPVLVREFVENGEQRKTKSFEIYEKARARGFFTRDDWRIFQRDLVTLPLYKQNELLGQKLIVDCFDGERHLFLLVGDGAYQGGVNGFGIDFKPDYSERTIL